MEVIKELLKLNSENYLILNNLTLAICTETNQIDHVVISKYGIFVIETKNYLGSIYGKKK